MTITEPDERWAELGRQECKVLAPYFRAVEHIGSTAVPGLPAKPIIDLMAAHEDLDDVNDDRLETFGYRLQPATMPDRLWFKRENYDSLAFHLHVVPLEGWAVRNERLFRDYLLAHPDACTRYAALKSELMERFGPGAAYTRGKTAFVQEITDAARAELGLPSVPVWEE